MREFLRNVKQTSATDGVLLIRYRTSHTGWAFTQAGHLGLTREYADGADPFKLPKHLRNIRTRKQRLNFDRIVEARTQAEVALNAGAEEQYRQQNASWLQNLDSKAKAVLQAFAEGNPSLVSYSSEDVAG